MDYVISFGFDHLSVLFHAFHTAVLLCLREQNYTEAQDDIWKLLQGCITLSYCCGFFTVTA
jgi:hypothetical protein